MAAIAPITINDGKATPVPHTFNPIATVPPTFRENGNSTVPVVGESEILFGQKKGNGTIQKQLVTLRVPVLEVQSGSSFAGYEAPPKVAFYHQVNIEFFVHSRSNKDTRKDVRVMARNLLDNPQVIAMFDNLEVSY